MGVETTTQDDLGRIVIDKAALEQLVEDKVNERLNGGYFSNSFSCQDDLSEGFRATQSKKLGRKQVVDLLTELWQRGGYISREAADKRDADGHVNLKQLFDAITSEEVRVLIPEVMTRILREPAEPAITGTPMLTRVDLPPGVPQISFPAVGGVQAFDVPESGVYHEQTLSFGGKSVAFVGKSGLKLAFTEEALRWSAFDIMSIGLRASRRALDRRKEDKAWTQAINNGTVIYDNLGSSVGGTRGRTTGRDIAGAYNHTFIVDDLLVMFADLVDAGYVPDTMATNPHGWLVMARDPVFRAFGFQNGQALFQAVRGQPGTRPSQFSPNVGVQTGQSNTANNPTASTWAPVPFFPTPLRTVVSAFIPFNSTLQSTTIMLFDSSTFGAIAQSIDPLVEEWKDPERDLRNVKIMEAYGLAVLEEGAGIALAQNVVTDKRAYDIEDLARWDLGQTAVPTGTPIGIG
jgi:hypothetical protein